MNGINWGNRSLTFADRIYSHSARTWNSQALINGGKDGVNVAVGAFFSGWGGMEVAMIMPMLKLLIIAILSYSLDCHRVIRVIDGDTIVLNTGEKVRLLGVDTPELHHPRKIIQCFGTEAKGFTESKVLNRVVRLSYEGVKYDRYGRTLAWVWYGDRLLNRDLIRAGYGFSYRKYPTSRLLEFNELERHAREGRVGLWGSCESY